MSSVSLDKICQLVRERNLYALEKLPYGSLYAKKGAESPVIKLARNGDVKSVDFLLDRGASIDEAVTAYAEKGHKKAVENLLERGANKNDALAGYAMGNYRQEVESLISDGADIGYALAGYAMGGHHEEVKNLISKEVDINNALYGYALASNKQAIDELLKDAKENNQSYDINQIAMPFAIKGKHKDVENFLKRGADINQVAKAYASAGNKKAVDDLLNRGADINAAALGYAMGGHHREVQNLFNGRASNYEDVVNVYAKYKRINVPLVCHTDHSIFRQKLMLKGNLLKFIKFVDRMRPLIKNHKLTYSEAETYLKKIGSSKTLMSWICVGPELIKRGKLQPDIYRQITNFLFETPSQKTANLVSTANERVLNAMGKSNRFFNDLINKKSSESEKTKEEEHSETSRTRKLDK